jgi:hypothetical protein
VNVGTKTTAVPVDTITQMAENGEGVDAGRRSLRVIPDDGAKTGITTSLNAGIQTGTDRTTSPTGSVPAIDFLSQ